MRALIQLFAACIQSHTHKQALEAARKLLRQCEAQLAEAAAERDAAAGERGQLEQQMQAGKQAIMGELDSMPSTAVGLIASRTSLEYVATRCQRHCYLSMSHTNRLRSAGASP
jgi:hypothetical protein